MNTGRVVPSGDSVSSDIISSAVALEDTTTALDALQARLSQAELSIVEATQAQSVSSEQFVHASKRASEAEQRAKAAYQQMAVKIKETENLRR